MEQRWVMDERLDAARGEVRAQPGALRVLNDVEVIDVCCRVVRNRRLHMWRARKRSVVKLRECLPLFVPTIKVAQLHAQQRRLQLVEPRVAPLDLFTQRGLVS